jgi:hypothetical protein
MNTYYIRYIILLHFDSYSGFDSYYEPNVGMRLSTAAAIGTISKQVCTFKNKYFTIDDLKEMFECAHKRGHIDITNFCIILQPYIW